VPGLRDLPAEPAFGLGHRLLQPVDLGEMALERVGGAVVRLGGCAQVRRTLLHPTGRGADVRTLLTQLPDALAQDHGVAVQVPLRRGVGAHLPRRPDPQTPVTG
jgi:hypothetical protein